MINEYKKRVAIKTAMNALRECAKLGITFSLEKNDKGQSIGFKDKNELLSTYEFEYEREFIVPHNIEPFYLMHDSYAFNYMSFMGNALEPQLYETDQHLRQELISELSKKETVYLIYTLKDNNHKKIWRVFGNFEDAKKALPNYEEFDSVKKSGTIYISGINGEDLHYWLNVYR